MENGTDILGGGMTGMEVGLTFGRPVFEAAESPGGICSSYYVRQDSSQRLFQAPRDGEAYRFEIGGHWIFGGAPAVLRTLTPIKSYSRRSAVYFHGKSLYVPRSLQNQLAVPGHGPVHGGRNSPCVPWKGMIFTRSAAILAGISRESRIRSRLVSSPAAV